jgi:hypothetical protein
MASREDNIALIIEFHRINKTSATDLRAKMLEVASGAFEQVTITGTGFEGGNAQGMVTFPQTDYLAGLMKLIRYLDPTVDAAVLDDAVVSVDFSQRMVQT